MRNCLMIFLIIVFVLALPGYFLFINVAQTITPSFIKKELSSTGTIEKISESLPKDLAAAISEDGSVDKLALDAFARNVSNKEISQTLQQNIDSTFTSLSNPSSRELVFDISKINQAIPPEIKQAMRESGEEELKDKYVYQIPPEIRLYRYAVNNLGLFKLFGIIGIIIFLLLIGLLARGWRTKFRAVSLSLLLPGIVIFLPFAIFRYWPIKLPNMSELPLIASTIIQDLFQIVKIDIANLYVVEGAILIGVSIVFFGLSFFFKSDHPEEPAAPKIEAKPAKA